MEKNNKKGNDVTTYSIQENANSGLELELHFMPKFFHENGCGMMPPHIHEFYQIIWFQHGEGTHRVDFTDYPVTDNTIFFVAPGQIHAFDGLDNYEGVIILFNANFLADEETSESVFLKYNVFNAYDSVPYYKVSNEETERLMALVDEMNREYSLTNSFAHKDYMQFLVRMFLIRVQRGGKRGEEPELYVPNIANQTLIRFRQLLEKNFRSLHTVQKYADLLNMSVRTFTKYVNQSAHRTPLELINDRIVLEAKRQLQHTTNNINVIGYELGFEDPSYFVKFFKRLVGMLPTEFRQKK